jgi:hypothetical protein
MARFALRTIVAGLALACTGASEASAQPASPVDIPLSFVANAGKGPYQLRIDIGINGGPSQPYLFDTGSALFNANVGNFFAAPSSFGASGNNVQYTYGPAGSIGTVTGNLVQVQSLSFSNGVTLTAIGVRDRSEVRDLEVRAPMSQAAYLLALSDAHSASGPALA